MYFNLITILVSKYNVLSEFEFGILQKVQSSNYISIGNLLQPHLRSRPRHWKLILYFLLSSWLLAEFVESVCVCGCVCM